MLSLADLILLFMLCMTIPVAIFLAVGYTIRNREY